MRVFFLASTDKRQRYRFVMEPLKSVGIDVSFFQEHSNPFRSFFNGMRCLLSTPKVDFVVLTGGDLRNVIWLFLLRILTKARIIVRFGGDPVTVRQSAQYSYGLSKNVFAVIRSRAGGFGSRLLLKHADGVIVVSDYLANTLRPMIGDETHLVVSPPVLLSECEPKRTYEKQEQSFNILTVTNLNYSEKADGVLVLVDAVKAACQKCPGLIIELNIVGGGLQLQHLKTKLSSTELPSNLTISVHGKQEDTGKYYRSADLFLYHSVLDSFSLVLLEAAAHGLPIVVNRWGPFPTLYQHGEEVLFYETEDTTELETLVIGLCESTELRAKLGQAALTSYQRNQALLPRGKRLEKFFYEVLR